MQNFSDPCVGNIFEIGVEWRRVGNVRFSTKNWSYLGNGERYLQGYY